MARYFAGQCGSVEQLLAQRVVAGLATPHLRVAEEEALVAGEAVDHRRRLAVLSDSVVGGVRDLEAAEVADVLAQRQLAVDVRARQRLERVVLRAERVGRAP